jgi:hypothetical protein
MANFESSDADRVLNEALWIVMAEQNQISAHESINTAMILGVVGVANTVVSLVIGGDFEASTFTDFIRESAHMLFGVSGIGAMGIAAIHLFRAADLKMRQSERSQ